MWFLRFEQKVSVTTSVKVVVSTLYAMQLTCFPPATMVAGFWVTHWVMSQAQTQGCLYYPVENTWAASAGRGGRVWTERSRSPRGCARAPSSRPPRTPQAAYSFATFFLASKLNSDPIGAGVATYAITCICARRVFIIVINLIKRHICLAVLYANISIVVHKLYYRK